MIQDAVKDRLDAMRGLSSEDILAALGLQRKQSPLDALFPAIGIFAAGLAVGTGVALLLAPKSGREMRREIKGKATEFSHRIGESADDIAQEVREAILQKGEEGSKTLENGTRKAAETTSRGSSLQK